MAWVLWQDSVSACVCVWEETARAKGVRGIWWQSGSQRLDPNGFLWPAAWRDWWKRGTLPSDFIPLYFRRNLYTFDAIADLRPSLGTFRECLSKNVATVWLLKVLPETKLPPLFCSFSFFFWRAFFCSQAFWIRHASRLSPRPVYFYTECVFIGCIFECLASDQTCTHSSPQRYRSVMRTEVMPDSGGDLRPYLATCWVAEACTVCLVEGSVTEQTAKLKKFKRNNKQNTTFRYSLWSISHISLWISRWCYWANIITFTGMHWCVYKRIQFRLLLHCTLNKFHTGWPKSLTP